MPRPTSARKFTRKPARKSFVKKGLNKTEKQEVVKIAKKAVQFSAEKKFTDSTQFTDMSFTQGRVGECPIACFGYSTTDNKTSSGAPILFGQRQVEQGHCLAPFFDFNRPDQVLGTEAYAIVGKEIKPSTCHTRMRIVRRYAALALHRV